MPRPISIVVAASLVAIPAQAARAQRNAASPDSLVARGLLDRAETAYYAATRARPRDPEARWELGRYLVSRGATRVGMTLIEEAAQFGFDKGRADSALAPIYLGLGEDRKLLALTPSPLSAAERERARFLELHPSRIVAPDTAIAAAYLPAATGTLLGTVAIRIDGRPVTARIVNGGPDLVVPAGSAAAKRLRIFPAPGKDAEGRVALADSIGISRLSITSVPVTLGAGSANDAQISLGFLARFAPSFDPRAGRITLRASGEAGAAPAGASSFLTLSQNGELRVLKAGGWTSPTEPELQRLLSARRWTLDHRRGTLVVEP